jgi:hypothetical protein
MNLYGLYRKLNNVYEESMPKTGVCNRAGEVIMNSPPKVHGYDQVKYIY